MIGRLSRRAIFALLAGLLVAACVRALAPLEPQSRPLIQVTLAITPVAVASMTDGRLRPDQTILLRGEQILAIGDAGTLAVPAGVPRIDGRGLTALPGLWDMHAHVLWTDAAHAVAHTLPFMLRHGIVGVRDMGSSLAAVQQGRALMRDAAVLLPDLVAAGPLIDGPRTRWSLPIAAATADDVSVEYAVRQAKAAGVDFIKPYGSLSPAAYRTLARAAAAAGLPIAGHVPNGVGADAALAVGQRSIEHLEVVLSRSCGRDDPAVVSSGWLVAWIGGGFPGRYAYEARARALRAADRCAALLARLAAAPLWWTPTIGLELRDVDVMDQRFRQIASPEQLAGCKTTARQIGRTPPKLHAAAKAAALADLALLHEAGVKLLAGSDFNNDCVIPVDGLFRELKHMVQAGLSPYEALRTATVEPAAYLKRSATAGTLEPGKIADILLVRGNPLVDIDALRNTDTVIRKGTIVNRLEPLLAGAVQ